MLMVVAVVVAVVVVLAVYEYEYRPGGPQNPYIVKVNQVIWTQDGQALSSAPGFEKHAGKTIQTGAWLTCLPYYNSGFFSGYYESVTCSSGSVYIQTPGFSLSSSNAPTTWSSGTSPDGTGQYISATVGLPSGAYTGNLTIDIR